MCLYNQAVCHQNFLSDWYKNLSPTSHQCKTQISSLQFLDLLSPSLLYLHRFHSFSILNKTFRQVAKIWLKSIIPKSPTLQWSSQITSLLVVPWSPRYFTVWSPPFSQFSHTQQNFSTEFFYVIPEISSFFTVPLSSRSFTICTAKPRIKYWRSSEIRAFQCNSLNLHCLRCSLDLLKDRQRYTEMRVP